MNHAFALFCRHDVSRKKHFSFCNCMNTTHLWLKAKRSSFVDFISFSRRHQLLNLVPWIFFELFYQTDRMVPFPLTFFHLLVQKSEYFVFSLQWQKWKSGSQEQLLKACNPNIGQIFDDLKQHDWSFSKMPKLLSAQTYAITWNEFKSFSNLLLQNFT